MCLRMCVYISIGKSGRNSIGKKSSAIRDSCHLTKPIRGQKHHKNQYYYYIRVQFSDDVGFGGFPFLYGGGHADPTILSERSQKSNQLSKLILNRSRLL